MSENEIYNTDTFMRGVVDWCIANETKSFTFADLPKQFPLKWHRQSISQGYLKRVNLSKSTSGATWKPHGFYLKMINCGSNHECPIKYSEQLSISSISRSISNGNITCRQISNHLCVRFTTVFQALKNHHDAGELERISVRNVYHYSIPEN
jgi:hypothetical protein